MTTLKGIGLALTLAILTSGCVARGVNTALDRIGTPIANEIIEYCSMPLYRREALWLLMNGALEDNDIQVAIHCPGDYEE